MRESSTDFAIVGGGILGTALAFHLSKRHPSKRIAVIEKEFDVPIVPTFPADILPVKEIEQEKFPATSATNTPLDIQTEVKYPNLSP